MGSSGSGQVLIICHHFRTQNCSAICSAELPCNMAARLSRGRKGAVGMGLDEHTMAFDALAALDGPPLVRCVAGEAVVLVSRLIARRAVYWWHSLTI